MITAQIHNDEWYAGEAGLTGGGRQPTIGVGLPAPLVGISLDENGDSQFGVDESWRERSDGTWDVDLSVSFAPPARPAIGLASIPLINLAARIDATGGTLQGGRSYYYAVSAVESDGMESPLSFVVRAGVPSTSSSNTVTLKDLSFGPGTTSFRVYRGLTPARMLRIANAQPVSATFLDTGRQSTAAAAPDANYHHANFYWRMELLPETSVDIHSTNSIGKTNLGLLANEHRGKIVRIHDGKGRGQELSISSNDATTLTTTTPWVVEPDSTSTFVITEPGWSFGAMSEGSPVTFTVPNRQNAVIHVSGRSANVADLECAYELSPLTRHSIGGGSNDADVPEAPVFGLMTVGRGSVEVAGVGFTDLKNTRSITAGTLMFHCWDELDGVPGLRLAAGIAALADTLVLTASSSSLPGVVLQIGTELLVARVISPDGKTCEVERGAFGTTVAAHTISEPVYALKRRVTVLPFVRNFFGSPASGSYAQSIEMPSQRVVLAEFFVTNGRGNSQVSSVSYSNTTDRGLRTLSGGQFTMQVAGNLAIQSDAVPPLSVDRPRSVRDVFATLAEPAAGGPLNIRVSRGATMWCDLTIPAGQSISSTVDGRDLPPLTPGTVLRLDVLSTGLAGTGRPGSGLTVTIRV
ncbi:MAG: hypothetical protein H7039_13960 [Bryobacteraceae bacterium]|nr:hypothetical protein [Bryobacteraceae bacterium]